MIAEQRLLPGRVLRGARAAVGSLMIIGLALLCALPALAAASMDHFSGTSMPVGWTAMVAGNGVVCMNGTGVAGSGGSCTGATTGETRLEFVSAATTDVAAIYGPSVSRNVSSVHWFRVRSVSSTTKISLVDKATPTADTTANTTGATGYVVALVTIGANSGAEVRVNRYNNARNQTDSNWTDSSKTWTNTQSLAMSTVADNYALIGFQIDGANARWRIIGCGNSGTGSSTPTYGLYCPLLTDWTNFSYSEGGGGFCNPTCGNLHFVLGDMVTNNDTTTGHFEYLSLNEGSVWDAWLNIRDNGGTWSIRHVFGVPNAEGFVEKFTLVDRVTNDLAVGTGGAWDDAHVKDPFITLGSNGTYYMCYSGSDGSKFSVGFATSSSVDGPWTKGANNPLITLAAGTTEDQAANCALVEDLTEPIAAKRWKLYYIGIDTSSPLQRSVFIRTCSAPPSDAACDQASDWSAKIALLGPGTGGNIDDLGYTRVIPKNFFGRAFVLASAKQNTGSALRASYGSGASYGAALTPSLVTLIGAQGSNCNTTLTVTTATTRTLTVGSTTGCSPDQFIIVDDDSNAANYHRHQILNVVNGTTLTLYNRDDAEASGGNVRGAEAFGQNDVGAIREYAPGKWIMYSTCFDPMLGAASGNDAYSENICPWKATSPLGPWTLDHLGSPVAIAHIFGANHSIENLSLVSGPFRSAVPFVSSN